VQKEEENYQFLTNVVTRHNLIAALCAGRSITSANSDQNMKTFSKEERLCSRKLLDQLFKNGSSFLLYPFRISYLRVEDSAESPVQVVINVSKKRYKRAVDRNLIKRRIREIYRIQKEELLLSKLPDNSGLLLLSLQYVGKEKHESDFMSKKLHTGLLKLVANLD
jgi:ribonuclease P protein component